MVEWTGQSRGGRFGFLFFIILIRIGCVALAPLVVFWVVLYFLVAMPKSRRASFDLARRLGRGDLLWKRLRFAYSHFYTFGIMLIDKTVILRGNVKRYTFESYGLEHIQSALATGRGAVFVTAHFGSWEVMGHLLKDLNAAVTLVMYDGVQPEMRSTIENLAMGRSFRVLFTDGSPASAAAILAALQRNEIVGMMGDRLLAGRGASVEFLGATAEFPTGPYVIAALANAPLLHAFCVRNGRQRYAFHAFSPEVITIKNRATREQELLQYVGSFARRLAEFVVKYPDNWGNFYPFWKTRESAA